MATRSIATDVLRLLDVAAVPIYLLDEKGRLRFLNEAAAAWAALPAADLLGAECRYHSSDEAAGVEAVAAALAPPPEVWMGRSARCVVTLTSAEGAAVSRRVDFIPLGGDAVELTGVVAFAAAEVCDPAALDALESESPVDGASQLHEHLRQWRRKLAGLYGLDRLIGDSPAMQLIRRQVALAADSTAAVSIVGPAGSGRQHVARAIHYGRAPQSAGALVPLVCPVLSTSVVESTVRALARSSAAAATARPATLLLSDVDQLGVESQDHLARCLSGDRGCRVVSTAREPLGELVARGAFSPALAAVLTTIEIRLPPLAERLDDLPLLAQVFVEDENRAGSKQLAGLTPEALDRLGAYRFPGNVRELAAVIADAHRRSEGPRITPGDLPAKVHVALDAAARPRKREETIVLEEFMARIEEELIRRALVRAKGNKAKAARLLGMTRPRLYRRLVQLGLVEPDDAAGSA